MFLRFAKVWCKISVLNAPHFSPPDFLSCHLPTSGPHIHPSTQLAASQQKWRAANEALENERAQHAISLQLAAAKEAVAAETEAELAQARETIAIGTDLLAAAQVTNAYRSQHPETIKLDLILCHKHCRNI